MILQYLGTGAAEGIPAMFCRCEICRESAALGGKSIRTRSQAILDGRILIDLPADTYLHFLQHSFPTLNLGHCLITHSHGDHLYPREITMRRTGFVDPENPYPLCFYGTEAVYRELAELYAEKLSANPENEKRIQIRKITPFVPFEADGYRITPLRANHDPKSDPVFYAIEKDGKALLYGHDTGPFPQETWEYLQAMGLTFDLVSLDSTYALLPGTDLGGHMNLTLNAQIKEKLLALGLADAHTRFIANHFSHRSGTHPQIAAEAEKIGFTAAYDGMTLSF